MIAVKHSIATRLALGYALLMAITFLLASVVFYFGTIGVLEHSIDGKITAISSRLSAAYQNRPLPDLLAEIQRELTDGIDSDTEIFLVINAQGQRVFGNLSETPAAWQFPNKLLTESVVREGKWVRARLIVRRLPSGHTLVVGRDLSEQRLIRNLVWRALGVGGAVAVLMAVAGALIFRQQLQWRLGDVRRTAEAIAGGNISRRIPISSTDEFGLLSADINRMLDRIEQLMEGVRHVSNAIAHDLRTPLTRIRVHLEGALQQKAQDAAALGASVEGAMGEIDDLIRLFDKLLQIAEAEAGVRPKTFEPVNLAGIMRDMVELYDAVMEEHGMTIRAMISDAPVWVLGDRNLLANAVANLMDNALKYAGAGARVELSVWREGGRVVLTVKDNGQGVPAEELPKLMARFYRLDRSRSLPGNGLGLAIVASIATMHGGELSLESANPGLLCGLVLPEATNLSKS